MKTSYLVYDFTYPEYLVWDHTRNMPYGAHEVVFVENTGGCISDAIRIHDCIQEDFETMTLLVPDRDRENQEDFIWCLPVERQKWNKWFALSEKYRGITPPNHGGVRYVNRVEDKEVKTVLVMPTEDQCDEDVVHACAYLRMVKNISCRMYVIRCTDDPLTGAKLLNKVMGTDPKDTENIEDEDITQPEAQVP